MFDKLKDFLSKRHLTNLKYYIRHRTSHKYHIINTGLKPDYYEIDAQMLHGMFSLLKDYVEIQCANMYFVCFEPDKKPKGWHNFFSKIRSAEYGVAYLKEQTSERSDKTEKEILDLYLWWTQERPNREDPWEAFDLAFEKIREEYRASNNMEEDEVAGRPFTLPKKTSNILKKCSKLHEAQQKEDTNNLVRLIKIRMALWT